mgnify:FL=1
MNLENELQKLKELVEKDLITQEDYDKKKDELLNTSNDSNIPETKNETKSVIGKNPRRKKIVTLILVIGPWGGIGFHRFYTGHYNTGILMLFTFGVFGVMWIMDIFRVLTDNFQDADGNELI